MIYSLTVCVQYYVWSCASLDDSEDCERGAADDGDLDVRERARALMWPWWVDAS